MPWLELLDVKKWPVPEPTGAAAGSDDADTSEAVFEFSMARKPERTLTISHADCVRLHTLVSTSSLNRVHLSRMQTALQAESVSARITRGGFERAMRSLVKVDAMRPRDRADFASALSSVFSAFQSGGGDESVDAVELTAGVALLVSGGKSDKLSMAFRLFDDEGRGAVKQGDLARYFRALLTTIVALQAVPRAGGHALAHAGALNSSLQVFATAALRDRTRVSYEEFGQWYNDGGFRALPWLELLDLKKWPVKAAEAPVASAAATAASSVSERDGESAGEADADGDDAPVFAFPLGDDGSVLTISASDVQHVQRVLEVSRFGRMEAEDLYALFDSEAEGGVLTKSAFDRCIMRCIPVEVMSESDRSFLSYALGAVFAAFDTVSNGRVNELEFAAGCSLLAAGSKSDKLSLAFRHFDHDADGYVDWAEMLRYFKGFITALCALASVRNVSGRPLSDLIWDTAAEMARSVFEGAVQDADGRISFEEFGSWYNDGGFRLVPWLELLDTRKWPVVAGSSGSGARARASAGAAASGIAKARKASSSDGSSGSAGALLKGGAVSISKADLVNMERLLQASKFEAVQPVRVHALLREQRLSGGVLDKEGFDRCVRALIPGESLSTDDKKFLSRALTNIFHAFDRAGNGRVDYAEFAAGFSMLASGSKSDKLSLAFRLFDGDADGFLQADEVHKYLRAFLTVLCAVQRCHSSPPSPAALQIIDRNAQDMTQTLFAQADLSHRGRISYEEFGRWYNDGGFDVVPWLELLDLKKWPAAAAVAASADDLEPSSAHALATKAKSGPQQSGGNTTLFVFSLGDDRQLSIKRRDVRNLERLLTISELSLQDAERVVDALASVAVDNTVDRDGFDAAVSVLVGRQPATREEQGFLSLSLENVFHAFDRNHNGRVDYAEFAAGLTLLAAGTKSDKLSLAFRLFDEDDDGCITRQEMWRFLLAFLTMLAALQSGSDDGPELSDRVLGQAAVDISGFIFNGVASAESRISYEEFGRWYNAGGFDVVPWLELLDLKKWPMEKAVPGVLRQQAAGAAGDNGAAAEDGDDDGDDDNNDDDDDDDDDDEQRNGGEGAAGSAAPETVVFKFSLTSDEAGGSKPSLTLTVEDCTRYRRLLAVSGLRNLSQSDVRSAFHDVLQARASSMSVAQLQRTVQLLAPQRGDSGAFIHSVLSESFGVLDRDGSGSVATSDAICAVLLLAAGSKSDKLSFAFRLFASSGEDDVLTVEELASFLRGFLTMLASLSKELRVRARP